MPRREAGQRQGLQLNLLRATEIDARLVGMLAALVAIWVGVDFLSGGAFLTPRNLWNLSVQTASVMVMASGMVLVIVAGQIDLSVGAMSGLLGALAALGEDVGDQREGGGEDQRGAEPHRAARGDYRANK